MKDINYWYGVSVIGNNRWQWKARKADYKSPEHVHKCLQRLYRQIASRHGVFDIETML